MKDEPFQGSLVFLRANYFLVGSFMRVVCEIPRGEPIIIIEKGFREAKHITFSEFYVKVLTSRGLGYIFDPDQNLGRETVGKETWRPR